MKTPYKVLLPLVLLLAPPAAVRAQFTYATNGGTITITYPSCPAGALTIPNVINGLPVTAIDPNAFEFCRSLTSVVISNNVTSIGRVAFWNCTSLASVTIGSRVADIGDYAFGECPSLTTVTIPNSVTNIGTDAFEYCTNLASVTLGTNIISIGDYAFWFCTSLRGVYFQGNAPSLGSSVFAGDQKATVYYLPGTSGWGPALEGLLTALWPVGNWTYTVSSGTITVTGQSGQGGAVTIPSAINRVPITAIGTNAFFNSISLTTVTLGTNVSSIGDKAFGSCANLMGVYFAGYPPSLGSSVFSGDKKATVYFLPGTSGWGPTFGDLPTAPWPVSNLTYIVEGGTITVTGQSGQGGAVTIPSTVYGVPVTRIGTNAFLNSTSLISVSIPNSVTNLGSYAFSGCTNLAGIYFQGNVPSLGSSVFASDDRATAYYLPGTTNWGATFGGRPAVLWNPQVQTSGTTFGVRTNRFGFTISGTSNLVIVVDASTNLANHKWAPVGTNTLTDGSSYFSDPQWKNYPTRFYRLRSP